MIKNSPVAFKGQFSWLNEKPYKTMSVETTSKEDLEIAKFVDEKVQSWNVSKIVKGYDYDKCPSYSLKLDSSKPMELSITVNISPEKLEFLDTKLKNGEGVSGRSWKLNPENSSKAVMEYVAKIFDAVRNLAIVKDPQNEVLDKEKAGFFNDHLGYTLNEII